jgi:hypothetical protein
MLGVMHGSMFLGLMKMFDDKEYISDIEKLKEDVFNLNQRMIPKLEEFYKFFGEETVRLVDHPMKIVTFYKRDRSTYQNYVAYCIKILPSFDGINEAKYDSYSFLTLYLDSYAKCEIVSISYQFIYHGDIRNKNLTYQDTITSISAATYCGTAYDREFYSIIKQFLLKNADIFSVAYADRG